MAKNSVPDWSTTAASNTDIGGVPLGEGVTLPSNVNNFERTEMAQLAQQLADQTATGQTMGGTASALTVQVNQAWTALASNLSFVFKNTVGPNTGPVTLEAFNNVPTSLGARALRMPGDTALVGGEMLLNGLYPVIYDPAYNSGAGAWVLISSTGGSIIAKIQTFTASGTYTPSGGMLFAVVEAQAPGGSGAGCGAPSNTQVGGAPGGGAGGYAKKTLLAAAVGASKTVTIGLPGAAPSAGGNNGNAGGNVSFGAILSATGGSGAIAAGASGTMITNPTPGGTATGGDINIAGSSGLPAWGVREAGGNYTIDGGFGGASVLGPGGSAALNTDGAAPAVGYGGGGGGGMASPASSARGGGAGGAGCVIVTEYCLQFGGAFPFSVPPSSIADGTAGLPLVGNGGSGPTYQRLAIAGGGTGGADAATARINLAVTTHVASITALLALNPAKDPVAWLDDVTRAGQYQWNASSLTTTLMGSNIASSAVSGNTITSNGYGLPVGTAVMVASAVNGLALNTLYWVIPVDANNFKLATTQALAVAGTAVTLTGTTATTVNQHFDPNKYIYVTPTGALNGSTGAWVSADGAWTQHGYKTQTPPPNVHRFNDRVLVGTGATGEDGVAGSWLFSQGTGQPMSYLSTNAKLAVVTGNGTGANIDSQYGLLGAARGVPGQAGGVIGVSGLGVNSDTSGIGTQAWGGYFESVRNPGAVKGNISVEIEVTNLNSTAVSVDPFNGPNTGSYGLEIGSGGGTATNPVSYDASCFIVCVDNGAKAKAGLVFNHLALTSDSGVFHAIEMEKASQIEWYYATTAVGTYIRSDIDTAADAVGLVFSDTSVSLLDETGASLFSVLQPVTGTVAASLTTQAGTTATNTVKVSVDGSATAASLQISPKAAAGQIVLTGGTAGIRLAINDTGIGFFGGSEVAKQAITGALSSVTDANAKTVLTSIKNLLVAYGLATDSTT